VTWPAGCAMRYSVIEESRTRDSSQYRRVRGLLSLALGRQRQPVVPARARCLSSCSTSNNSGARAVAAAILCAHWHLRSPDRRGTSKGRLLGAEVSFSRKRCPVPPPVAFHPFPLDEEVESAREASYVRLRIALCAERAGRIRRAERPPRTCRRSRTRAPVVPALRSGSVAASSSSWQ
jgi:hypothetical protein